MHQWKLSYACVALLSMMVTAGGDAVRADYIVTEPRVERHPKFQVPVLDKRSVIEVERYALSEVKSDATEHGGRLYVWLEIRSLPFLTGGLLEIMRGRWSTHIAAMPDGRFQGTTSLRLARFRILVPGRGVAIQHELLHNRWTWSVAIRGRSLTLSPDHSHAPKFAAARHVHRFVSEILNLDPRHVRLRAPGLREIEAILREGRNSDDAPPRPDWRAPYGLPDKPSTARPNRRDPYFKPDRPPFPLRPRAPD